MTTAGSGRGSASWAALTPVLPRWASSTRISSSSAQPPRSCSAGYSQGAMVVHRNLQALAASPNLAAVLLVADGDRRPDDPTLNLGTVSGLPKHGKGVAQDWPILAHAPAVLPADIGAKTISVCDLGDAVCDYPTPTRTRRPRAPWPSTRVTPAKLRDWSGRRRCTSSLGRPRPHLRDRCQGRTRARSPTPPRLRAAIALPAPRRWHRSHPPPTIPRAEASPTPFRTPQHRHRRVSPTPSTSRPRPHPPARDGRRPASPRS